MNEKPIDDFFKWLKKDEKAGEKFQKYCLFKIAKRTSLNFLPENGQNAGMADAELDNVFSLILEACITLVNKHLNGTSYEKLQIDLDTIIRNECRRYFFRENPLKNSLRGTIGRNLKNLAEQGKLLVKKLAGALVYWRTDSKPTVEYSHKNNFKDLKPHLKKLYNIPLAIKADDFKTRERKRIAFENIDKFIEALFSIDHVKNFFWKPSKMADLVAHFIEQSQRNRRQAEKESDKPVAERTDTFFNISFESFNDDRGIEGEDAPALNPRLEYESSQRKISEQSKHYLTDNVSSWVESCYLKFHNFFKKADEAAKIFIYRVALSSPDLLPERDDVTAWISKISQAKKQSNITPTCFIAEKLNVSTGKVSNYVKGVGKFFNLMLEDFDDLEAFEIKDSEALGDLMRGLIERLFQRYFPEVLL